LIAEKASMSDSTEDLQRKFDAALAARKKAEEDFRAIRKDLQEAKCRDWRAELEAKGITPGTKVTDRYGEIVVGFMGVEPSPMASDTAGLSLILHKVNKDGSVGNQRIRPHGFDFPSVKLAP
jgi:hypothetical protein